MTQQVYSAVHLCSETNKQGTAESRPITELPSFWSKQRVQKAQAGLSEALHQNSLTPSSASLRGKLSFVLSLSSGGRGISLPLVGRQYADRLSVSDHTRLEGAWALSDELKE